MTRAALCSLEVTISFRDACKVTIQGPDGTASPPVDAEVSVTTNGELLVVGNGVFVSRHDARIVRSTTFPNEFYVNLGQSCVRMRFDTILMADIFQSNVLTTAHYTRIVFKAASRALLGVGLAALLRPVASAVASAVFRK